MLIPKLLNEFRNERLNFKIIITAPPSEVKSYNEFMINIRKYGVESMIYVIGPVKKQQLPSLYKKVDYVFLLSKLESFSNNIIESWYFKKTLVISDEEWSRSICKNAAIYVDRNNPHDIVNIISKLEKKINSSIQLLKTEIKY